MDDLLSQLPFPADMDSPETQYVRKMKESILADPMPKGDRLRFNIMLPRALHAKLLAAAAAHDMTIADVTRVLWVRALPILQRAQKVDVPGWGKEGDQRTHKALARMNRRQAGK